MGKENERIVRENGISLILSGDKMRLYMSYDPTLSDSKPSLEDVQGLARKIEITEKLTNSILSHYLKLGSEFKQILIAEGKVPKHAFDAKILFEVNVSQKGKPSRSSDGTVNYRNLGNIVQVREGDVIAQKLPPAVGFPGKTLTGEKIEFEPKDVELPMGKNTRISHDRMTLSSTVNGMVEYVNGVINVWETYKVDGDVGYDTGNIDFSGKVEVNGDVQPGFILKADGDINIFGCVEMANIISRKGNITIEGGIIGKGDSKIIAAKNLNVAFIQDAKITVGKDVIAGRYILNSDLNAEGCIKVLDSEGTIRGGSITSQNRIEAKIVGSNSRIPTHLNVGKNLSGDSLKKILEIDRHIKDLSSQRENNDQKISFINLLEERIVELSAEKLSEKEILIHANEELSMELERLEKSKMELLSDAFTKNLDKHIDIHAKVFPGVVINIDYQEFLVEQELIGSIFKLEKGIIKVEHSTKF